MELDHEAWFLLRQEEEYALNGLACHPSDDCGDEHGVQSC